MSVLSNQELHELQLQLNVQQDLINKQNSTILNLKAQLANASEKNAALYEEKQQVNRMLARGISMQKTLASVLIHEINQPLTAITTYGHSCLLVAKNKVQYEKKQYELVQLLEALAGQTKYLGNMMHHMRSILDEGDFHVDNVDINELVKEVLSTLSGELPCKVTAHLMGDLSRIMTNKTSLMHVMLHLVRQRIEVLPNTEAVCSELLVETLESNKQIIIHFFIHNKLSISGQCNESVMDTYFTADTQETSIHLGVFRALIESIGGALCIHHENKKGSGFTLSFPTHLEQ